MSVLEDVRQLSSGTIANLTGCHYYDAIDLYRERLADFVAENPEYYETWQEAWQDFASLTGWSLLVVRVGYLIQVMPGKAYDKLRGLGLPVALLRELPSDDAITAACGDRDMTAVLKDGRWIGLNAA